MPLCAAHLPQFGRVRLLTRALRVVKCTIFLRYQLFACSVRCEYTEEWLIEKLCPYFGPLILLSVGMFQLLNSLQFS
jgi:hypothetical protein